MDQQRFVQASAAFESGLSFDQIFSFAKRRMRSIAGLAILGAIAGIGVALVLPDEWQATDVIQVGQITRTLITNGNTNVIVQPLEPAARTVDRMSLRQFQDDVLKSLGLPLERGRSSETALVRDYAQVDLRRDGDLVTITARGYTPEQAKQVVAAYEKLIIDAHQALLQPSVNRMSAELQQAKSALTAAQRRESVLNSQSTDMLKGAEGRFSADVLRDSLVQRNDEELHRFAQRIEEIQEDLNPARTFNTRPLMSSIEVGDRPVFPRKSTAAELGALIGFAVGVCLGLLLDNRARKASR
ncbi:Wzz/FepE/Etk N-terminal domain-containing protein [Trinickia sp.]|uniref:Wzz/FepE/Etk N-terminal domain-containing protein n=1 Tax=Trinickia sp. TaxID=2571163 RepID=UPI003F811336